MSEQVYDHIRSLVTMNDAQFAGFALSTGDPLAAFDALMDLVNSGRVLMTNMVDATGRTIGGVYSLPGTAQVARVALDRLALEALKRAR